MGKNVIVFTQAYLICLNRTMIFFLMNLLEIPISSKSSSFKVAKVPPLISFSSKSLMYSSLTWIVLSHSHNSLVVIFSACPLGLADSHNDAAGLVTDPVMAKLCTETGDAGSATT